MLKKQDLARFENKHKYDGVYGKKWMTHNLKATNEYN